MAIELTLVVKWKELYLFNTDFSPTKGEFADWITDKNKAWKYSSIVAFDDAKKYDGKVFILTRTREIEVTREDFFDVIYEYPDGVYIRFR